MAIDAGGVYAELNLNTGKFNTAIMNAEKRMEMLSGKLQKIGGKMESVGKSLTKKVSLPLVGIGAAATKASIDFESAFAGVKKTVDATDEQLAKLETGIRDMSKEIPASATDISEVAEAAGQLGIKTENILDFTRVMIDLGESTNLSADEAATSLARLANITGMSQQDFDRVGSTIVDLGNNLATTESEIVAMGLRLAGAGTQIGLSEAQIMSFSGALSSVGIEAEAGGSAFSKVMVDMQLAVETGSEKLNDFAKVAGMSTSDFKKTFKEDAAGAIIAFIQGLGTAEERGMSAIKVLDDMGITEVRLRDALLRASGASDVFTESLEIGTKAWDENNALSNESAQRYETTAAKFAIFKNQVIDVGKQIGDILIPHLMNAVEKFQEWIDKFANLDKGTQETIIKLAGIAAAIGPLMIVGGKLADETSKVIGLGSKLTENWGTINTVGSILATGLKSTVGLVFSPTGAIIAGIAATIAIGVALYKNWDKIKEGAGKLTEAISERWNNIKDKTSKTWDKIRTSTSEKWEDIRKKVDDNVSKVKKKIISSIKKSNKEWGEKTASMLKATKDNFGNIANKAKEAFGKVVDSIKLGLDKIKEWNATKVKSKVATFTQKIKTVGEKISNVIGKNALGTNYWRGGLTWVNNCPVVEKLAA